jgi:carboxypeptidase Taq
MNAGGRADSPYGQLERRFRRISLLGEAAAVLHWDSAVMMPAGGADVRADQLSELSLLSHELLTDPRVADLLDAAETEFVSCEDEAGWVGANLVEMRRRWLHATAVPGDLVAALSKACSTCEVVWRRARPANEFEAVRAHLETVVSLTRESAVAKADVLDLSPYDALLDQYDPGTRELAFAPIFDRLSSFLPEFVEAALARQDALPAPTVPAGPFPKALQREFAHDVMRRLGFDFEFGRLDTSHHPFSGGVPEDLRLTTRYDEADFVTGLMGVIHETGHALYERGLPSAWRHQPVAAARGMTLHESQSLLFEMQACRSDAFIGFIAPLARETFGGDPRAWDVGNITRLYRTVAPGLIRVDADEVTYPAHVILRYRLERAMITGDLGVADLPGAWRDEMAAVLGIIPPDDRDGCMQDIHWFDGAFGYFPTYTLGAIAAAQLFAAACRAVPDVPEAIGRGDFRPLLAWLKENVHGLGSRYSTSELLQRATGRALDVEAYIDHLRDRYLG